MDLHISQLCAAFKQIIWQQSQLIVVEASVEMLLETETQSIEGTYTLVSCVQPSNKLFGSRVN